MAELKLSELVESPERGCHLLLGEAIVGWFPIPSGDHMWRTVRCLISGATSDVWNWVDAATASIDHLADAIGRDSFSLSEYLQKVVDEELAECEPDGENDRWTIHLRWLSGRSGNRCTCELCQPKSPDLDNLPDPDRGG